MKILIAEDDTTTRMVLQNMVKRMGHEPVLASNGQEGLEAFQREAPRVVITDWVMPESDGLELSRKIRSIPGDQYTYIILVTMKKDKPSFIEGMHAGVDDYMAKPVDTDELQARIKVGERITNSR